MAAEQNISLAEAEKRLGWQEHATNLKTRTRASLGTARFGGLWIDPDDSDRLKVGVVGATATDRTTVANVATAEGVADAVDMVGVRYSEAQLQSAMDWISDRLASVNKKARWPLQLAHSVRANRLRLDLPRKGTLTSVQQVLRGRLRSRYGDMLQAGTYEGRPVGDQCQFPYCYPPLRAGIRVWAPVGGYCTNGFLARSKTDNKLYAFTAGHCPWAGGVGSVTDPWYTWFYEGGADHGLGPAHNGFWNRDGDMGIIRVINEAGWNPRAWVYVGASSDTTRNPEYPIRSDDYSQEGQRICHTGVTTGTDCGEVLDLGYTATYSVTSITGAVRTETVTGLGRTSYCHADGDSGGPVYASNKAFGIHVGGPDGVCVGWYQGIKEAETDMRVNVAHHAG